MVNLDAWYTKISAIVSTFITMTRDTTSFKQFYNVRNLAYRKTSSRTVLEDITSYYAGSCQPRTLLAGVGLALSASMCRPRDELEGYALAPSLKAIVGCQAIKRWSFRSGVGFGCLTVTGS